MAKEMIRMIKGAEGAKVALKDKDKFLKDGWEVVTVVKGVAKREGLAKNDAEALKAANKKIVKLEEELKALKAKK